MQSSTVSFVPSASVASVYMYRKGVEVSEGFRAKGRALIAMEGMRRGGSITKSRRETESKGRNSGEWKTV